MPEESCDRVGADTPASFRAWCEGRGMKVRKVQRSASGFLVARLGAPYMGGDLAQLSGRDVWLYRGDEAVARIDGPGFWRR